MRPKGAKWAHLSQFWPQTPTNPELAKTTLRPKIGLWQPPEATSSASSKDSPQFQGKTFPSSMHRIIKDPGVVHIWYNIPLCTIFGQQSNYDTFRTKLCDSKSSPQSIINFEGGCFSYSVWQLPEDHVRTPTTWPCRSWVINYHQNYSKGNSQRLSFISIIVNASSTQHSLDSSIGPYR
ncbi:hypothetical protein O181_095897 [Austropuccinia psidii MF-1]|uniref:Uncharacterized protein n=1 Tax=Austropuccinia psidii MF-1 TaxID=1389203 RepID=A0A9Q3J5N9_9BASI|nr:hypothetical protein [Austropuccinia psidii MF-1]